MTMMTMMVTMMVTMMMMMVKDDNGGKCNGEWSTAGARVAAHSPTVILIITIRKIWWFIVIMKIISSSSLWSTLSYGGYFTGRKCVRILRFLKIVKDFEISKRYWNWARGGRGGYLFICCSSRGRRLPMRPKIQKSLWQEKDLWLVDWRAQYGAATRARKTMVANGLWGK